jgi:tetratricopeptide (TPR) repeat protein
MILALARPEVLEVFPRLWEGRDVQTLRLQELKRTSSEKLVREVLGSRVSDAVVADLAGRAAGNAFYLEELIRAVAEGKGDALPDTVIAMAQARLESLEPGARQILRAASIFGQVFSSHGVATLLGGTLQTAAVSEWLDELVNREIVTKRREGRFADPTEYVFRHALLREAAYAMLTDEDRALGHRLAGAWLKAAGERDAIVLAEHFERGGDHASAAEWWKVAADQALEGDDLASAIEHAERGARAGAEGENLGALRLVQAEAHAWRAEHGQGQMRSSEAMKLLPRACAAWFKAAAVFVETSGRLAERDNVLWIVQQLIAMPADPSTHTAYASAAAKAVSLLYTVGIHDLVEPLLERLRAMQREAGDANPVVTTWITNATSWYRMFQGDHGACLVLDGAVADGFAAIGDQRRACEHRANVAYDHMVLGLYPEAEAAFREALAQSERIGLWAIVAMIHHNLGYTLAYQGSFTAAITEEQLAIDQYEIQRDPRMTSAARGYMGIIRLLAGDLVGAEIEARRACERVDALPVWVNAATTLARIRLSAGDPREALELATEAVKRLEQGAGVGEGEQFARLVYAEALHASGDHDGAARAIRYAAMRLRENAAKISDPKWRESYLERVPEHARTIMLEKAWTGGG